MDRYRVELTISRSIMCSHFSVEQLDKILSLDRHLTSGSAIPVPGYHEARQTNIHSSGDTTGSKIEAGTRVREYDATHRIVGKQYQQFAAIQSNSSLSSAPTMYPFSSVYPVHQSQSADQGRTYARNDAEEDDQQAPPSQ